MSSDSPKTDKPRKRRGPSDEEKAMLRNASLAMLIPGLMLAGPIVGYLLGRWLGGALFDRPDTGAFIGLLAGIVAGGREVVRVVRRLGKE